MQHVIYQPIQSPTISAPVTRLANKHAEIAVAREAKLREHNIKQKPDNVQNILLSSLTARWKDSSKKS